MTFLQGFAQGFTDERKQRLDRENELEDTKFKYGMDSLMKLRAKRDEQSQKETEWKKQSEDLGAQAGDTNFSQVAYKELQNGVSYEEVQKRQAAGEYEKNPQYKAPTQTVQVAQPGASMPTAVSTPYDTGSPDVNKRIDEIDPNLRSVNAGIPDQRTVTNTDPVNTPYVFKPKGQYKIGDYGDVLYEQQQAQQSGDPARIRAADDKVRIAQRVLSEKAKSDASIAAAANPNKKLGTYISLNDDGSINSQFQGEVRDDPNNPGKQTLWNTANPIEPQQVTGKVKYFSEDDQKRYNDLQDKFYVKTKEYNDASTAFIAASDASNEMVKILQKDPNVATYTAKGFQIAKNLKGEIGAMYGSVLNTEAQLNAKIKSGNMDGIEKDVADYSNQIQDFMNKTVTTPGNEQTAVNRAIFDSLRIKAAYQYAIANGLGSGKSLSNADFEASLTQIGGDSTFGGGDNSALGIIKNIEQTAQSSFTRMKAAQDTINSDPSISDFEQRMGYKDPQTGVVIPLKSGLRARRIGDVVMKMDLPEDKRKALLLFLGKANGTYEKGKDEAVSTAKTSTPGYRDPMVNAPGGVNPDEQTAQPVQADKSNQTVQDKISNGDIKIGDVITNKDGRKFRLKSFDPAIGLRKENLEEVK